MSLYFRVLILERTGKIIYFTRSILKNFKCIMMFSDMDFLFHKKNKRACGRAQLVGWLVILRLTAL